jgi:hypothetical protein
VTTQVEPRRGRDRGTPRSISTRQRQGRTALHPSPPRLRQRAKVPHALPSRRNQPDQPLRALLSPVCTLKPAPPEPWEPPKPISYPIKSSLILIIISFPTPAGPSCLPAPPQCRNSPPSGKPARPCPCARRRAACGDQQGRWHAATAIAAITESDARLAIMGAKAQLMHSTPPPHTHTLTLELKPHKHTHTHTHIHTHRHM